MSFPKQREVDTFKARIRVLEELNLEVIFLQTDVGEVIRLADPTDHLMYIFSSSDYSDFMLRTDLYLTGYRHGFRDSSPRETDSIVTSEIAKLKGE